MKLCLGVFTETSMGLRSCNHLSANHCIPGLSPGFDAFTDFPLSICKAHLQVKGVLGPGAPFLNKQTWILRAFGLFTWKSRLPSLSTAVFTPPLCIMTGAPPLCALTGFVTQLWNLSSPRAGLVLDSQCLFSSRQLCTYSAV